MYHMAVVLPLTVLARLTILREQGLDPASLIQSTWRTIKARAKAATNIARHVRGYVVRSVREYGIGYDLYKRLYYRQGYGAIARWRLNAHGFFRRDVMINDAIIRRRRMRVSEDRAIMEQIRTETGTTRGWMIEYLS